MRQERHIEFDRGKLKALIHYVCHRAPNPHKLGATKLNKILYYSDIEAYLELGDPITGETYVKQQFGPVSKHITELLDELKEERALAVREDDLAYALYTGEPYSQRLFFSLRRPDLTGFDPKEVSIIDEIVYIICEEHTARSISEFSHGIVWKSAEIGEELPYYTAFVHQLGEIRAEDMEWAKQQLAERGFSGDVSEA